MIEPDHPQFCPECGAGIIERTETHIVARLPRGYPVEPHCKTGEEAGHERMRELGRKHRELVNEKFWEAFTSRFM